MSNTIKVTPYRSIEPTRIFFLYVVLILILFIILTIILISFFLEAFHGNKDSGSDSEPESGSQPEPEKGSGSQLEPGSNIPQELEPESIESIFELDPELEEILLQIKIKLEHSACLEVLKEIEQARKAEYQRQLEWHKMGGGDPWTEKECRKAALNHQRDLLLKWRDKK